MIIAKKFYSLIVLPFVAILLMFGGQIWAQVSKPNILILFPDDVGWQNVSAYAFAFTVAIVLSAAAGAAGRENPLKYVLVR